MPFNPDDVKLLDDRILVRRIDRGVEETAGGIVIPDQAQELGDCAEVIAVGPGNRLESDPSQREPLDVAPGDEVIISRYAGTEISMGNSKYLVLRAQDVLATVVDA